MTASDTGSAAQTAPGNIPAGPATVPPRPVPASLAATGSATRAAAPAKGEPRALLRMLLGNGYVFGAALVLLFVTAGLIEAYGTKETFRLSCILLFIEIALPAFLAGIIAKGRILGMLIDDRNRMSLGRFQVFIWSLIILASYFSMALWNIRIGAHLPQVPDDIWILLGITNASAVASTMVLNPKRRYTQAVAQSLSDAQDDPAAPPPPTPTVHQSLLDVRESPYHANWTDLFFGEEDSNKGTVDVSRLQQFAFTVILLFVFAGKVFEKIAGTDTGALDMPDMDPSALGLLGFSNVSYLASKQAAKPGVAAK